MKLSFQLQAVCRIVLAIAVVGMSSGVPINAQGVLAITGARLETLGKAGTIENGTILIRDGKIVELGKSVDIPIAARVIDGSGKTITPGFVDPYYVVGIGRNVRASEARTVVFNGRTFTIGGGTPAIATTFAKVSDGLDVTELDWEIARRSGLTTLHLVTGGFAQGAVAEMAPEYVKLRQPEAGLLVTVTNDSNSLKVLKSGLEAKKESRGGGRPAAGARGGSGASGGSRSSPAESLWEAVREGKELAFVNVNNAAAILHVNQQRKEMPKANIALIASGGDTFLALGSVDATDFSFILSPSIDLVPNSQNRVNVPQMLADKKATFAFSLSLGQSDFRSQQEAPLFAVAMLVRAGLDAETALKALTIVPAKMIGMEKEIGTLEVDKRANLIMFDGKPLEATSAIEKVIVEGEVVYED